LCVFICSDAFVFVSVFASPLRQSADEELSRSDFAASVFASPPGAEIEDDNCIESNSDADMPDTKDSETLSCTDFESDSDSALVASSLGAGCSEGFLETNEFED